MEHKNTLPGYEIENGDRIPDDQDNGVGLSAGDKVYHEEYGIGYVLAIFNGKGTFYSGRVMADVAFGPAAEDAWDVSELNINKTDGEWEDEGIFSERLDPYSLELEE